jgi:hypothetical protein
VLAVEDAGHVAALPFPFAGLGSDTVGVELIGNLLVTAADVVPQMRDTPDDRLLGRVVHQPIQRPAILWIDTARL